jgi:hypothetical protein
MSLTKEPAVIITAVTAFLTEVFGLCVAFGIHISDVQQNAIIATVTALAALIALLGPVIRQFVYSQHSVNIITQNAASSGDPVPPAPPAA